jgi:RES domain-containing protein
VRIIASLYNLPIKTDHQRVEKGKALILLITSRATRKQVEEMQQALGTYIKLAVDINLGILAGGGALHADCESVLLENGSAQEDVWGADWIPSTQQVTFESLINLRPRQKNFALEIKDPAIRKQVADIACELLGDK